FTCVTRTRTRSPGIASGTKTTSGRSPSASWCRATNTPPWATPVTSRSRISPLSIPLSSHPYAGRMQVCLASTSPARLMLMRQVGGEPRLEPPGVDEEAPVAAREADDARTLEPYEHGPFPGRLQADDVARRLASEGFEGLVIGGDSMFEIGGEVLGKPHTVERAIARWRDMRGRTGVLHSGHSVIRIADGELTRADAATQASVTFAS